MNGFQINVIIRGHGLFQILPPVIQKPFFTNETEPWRKEQRFVTHHFNQDIASDPFHVVYFVGMTFDSEIRLRRDGVEKDVVDFVFAPRTVVSLTMRFNTIRLNNNSVVRNDSFVPNTFFSFSNILFVAVS